MKQQQERAKALGLSLTSQADGPNSVRVGLEFEKQGELKEYKRDRATRVRYVLPMKDFVTKSEGLTQP